MTKPEFIRLLEIHQQWFPGSCAASGMELILKFHKKKDPDWFGFQSEFQNENIGWKKIERLKDFGILATNSQCDLDTFLAKLENQSIPHRLMLFSLPTLGFLNLIYGTLVGIGPEYHIFLAAKFDQKSIFVSKQFLNLKIIDVPDLRRTYDLIHQVDSQYLIDTLTYELLPVA